MKFSIAVFALVFVTFANAEKPVIQVVGLYNPPWLSTEEGDNGQLYNDGFIMDVLDELSNKLDVKFNVTLPHKVNYGYKTADGKWTGLIGRVVDETTELAVGDITITAERQKVVDFSLPLAHTEIGVLIKRPPYYLSTNDTDVRDKRTKPLIIYPVSNYEDLSRQQFVKYGVVPNGSTHHFFKESSNPIYKKIGEHLNHQTDLPKSYGEAATRVYDSDGKYVFFMEGTSIDYLTSKDCDFSRFDESIGSRRFGIAMKKGYHLRERINSVIAVMHESGVMKRLRRKWFGAPLPCHTHLEPIYKRQILNVVINGLK